MAEFYDAEEEKALDPILGAFTGYHYWIGLTDLNTEGTWRWEETHQVAEYTNWYIDGREDEPSGDGDCVVKEWGLHWDGARPWEGTWTDVPCDGHANILCQKLK